MLALYKASANEKIVYIVSRPTLAEWTMRKALDMLSVYGVSITVKKGRRMIEINGAGSVEFLVISHTGDVDRLRGRSGNLIEDLDQ